MASGLFADHGLDVEVLEPAPGPENVVRVAEGGAEFCLTSVSHYLTARARAGDLGARFAAVIVQRSPMAALVPADSPIAAPAHLPGRRLGGPPEGGLVAEYGAALAHLGLGPPVLVPMAYADAPPALARGEIDAVADFVDLLPRVRGQAGIAVRAVPFGIEVYASGLVAADTLPDEVVGTMREAVAQALERQRRDPGAGLGELRRRYPGVDPADALEGWSLAEPNIFSGAEPRSMDPGRWEATVTYAAAAHALPAPPPEAVYRPELAGVAPSA